jgi:hypothetical protein
MAVSCRTATAARAPVEPLQVFVRYTPNEHSWIAERPAQQPGPPSGILPRRTVSGPSLPQRLVRPDHLDHSPGERASAAAGPRRPPTPAPSAYRTCAAIAPRGPAARPPP